MYFKNMKEILIIKSTPSKALFQTKFKDEFVSFITLHRLADSQDYEEPSLTTVLRAPANFLAAFYELINVKYDRVRIYI